MFASTQVYYNSAVDDSKEYLKVYMNVFSGEFTLNLQGANAFSEKLNGARVTFMDSQGNVLADSETGEELENHYNRSEIQDAIFKGEGFAVRSSSTLGKNMVYFCKNFDGRFLVRIAVYADSDLKIFAKTLPLILEYSVILIALSAVISFISAHFISKSTLKCKRNAVLHKEELN